MNLIEKSKNYATEMHSNCKYGDFPYDVHLAKVVETAEKFIYLIPKDYREIIVAACWAHDVIEDTGQNYNDVKHILGKDVADIVYNVTNELGKNRAERAEKTYPKISTDYLSVFVKCCDRYANTLESKNTQHKMYAKYIVEYTKFRNYLYNNIHMFDELWAALDEVNSGKEEI